MMRPKPDVTPFATPQKDPSAFIDGANDDSPGAATTPPAAPSAPQTVTITVTKPEPTIQKLFRLRWDVANALKACAAEESAVNGRRVTETEIVERLLRQKLGI